MSIVLVDYGMGNLLSVQRAIEHLNFTVTISSNPNEILSADKLILPGVGSFPDAMKELDRLQLLGVIKTLAIKKVPILGICLGMQILFDYGEEFDGAVGLGLIPGKVVPIPNIDENGVKQKIPHIGWGELRLPLNKVDWSNSILSTTVPGQSVYFVHSFMAMPDDLNARYAECIYGSTAIVAVVRNDNVWGCQFHPEKSGDIGLSILREFLLIS